MLLFCAVHFAKPLNAISLHLTAPMRGRLSSACVHVCSVVSESLRPHELEPARLLCPWDSPGKNSWASLIAQLVKNPPATQETPVQLLGWEGPLEKG